MSGRSYTSDEIQRAIESLAGQINGLEANLKQKREMLSSLQYSVEILPALIAGTPPQKEKKKPDTSTIDSPDDEPELSVAEAAYSVAQDLGGEFTSVQIRKAIDQYYPGLMAKRDKSAISQALARMLKAGAIKQISKGSGKRPGIYRLA